MWLRWFDEQSHDAQDWLDRELWDGIELGTERDVPVHLRAHGLYRFAAGNIGGAILHAPS